jgi:glutathione S-transferase
MYTLYVIPGSHACRTAMLMLEHKRIPYRRVDILTLTHPVVVRLYGFDAGGQTRSAGGRRTLGIRMGDRLGTVPALAANGDRISTNHRIARYLDERHPEPALFPEDPAQRAAVEEVERWANETLQMTARRIAVAAAVRDPAAMARAAGDGRLGYLLYKREAVRRVIFPRLLGRIFVSGPARECEIFAELEPILDRIDAWIADGVLGGTELNAADFMVTPSLALILYRPDVRPMFEGRPALALVDRLLPEPAAQA